MTNQERELTRQKINYTLHNLTVEEMAELQDETLNDYLFIDGKDNHEELIMYAIAKGFTLGYLRGLKAKG